MYRPWASAHRGKWGQMTPWKNGCKIKQRKQAKRGQAGVENGAHADHIFIQMYFRMHHFVVIVFHFLRLRRQGGIDPPNQSPADALGIG